MIISYAITCSFTLTWIFFLLLIKQNKISKKLGRKSKNTWNGKEFFKISLFFAEWMIGRILVVVSILWNCQLKLYLNSTRALRFIFLLRCFANSWSDNESEEITDRIGSFAKNMFLHMWKYLTSSLTSFIMNPALNIRIVLARKDVSHLHGSTMCCVLHGKASLDGIDSWVRCSFPGEIDINIKNY